MKRAMSLALALCCCATPALAGQTGWMDVLDKVQSQVPAKSASSSGGLAANLSDADVGKGLKEALAQGTQKAVTALGRTDGYFGNQAVRILLPESLQKVEAPLRLAGQGKLVDDLVLAMNRAAEKAVPQAASILSDAVRAMTMQDAHGILSGPQDSATQYFRTSSGAKIGEMMQPIIAKSMDSVGVAKAYNRLTASPLAASLAQSYGLDLNGYVNAKAQDGLFTLIAKEEQNIRANPAARGTDILKKVFGGK